MSSKQEMKLRRPARILVAAGEDSGDQMGAQVLQMLHQLGTPTETAGMGGDALKASGMRCIVELSKLTVLGTTEVIKKIPRIIDGFCTLEAFARIWQPDVALLIDFPDFNLRLASALKKLGIPIVYYVSPQIWAWRRARIKQIAQNIDHMLVVFPFEEDLYRKAGVAVTFVGHPLLDRLKTVTTTDSGSKAQAPLIALLPGSRPTEVDHILPFMLQTAEILKRHTHPIGFVVAQATTITDFALERHLRKTELRIEVVKGRTLEVLGRSNAALVASGTATLEAAAMGTPTVVVYRTSMTTYFLARVLIRNIRHIGMVNILAGHQIVPEHVQWLDPLHMAAQVRSFLENPAMLAGLKTQLKQVTDCLGEPGASFRAAQVLMHVLEA